MKIKLNKIKDSDFYTIIRAEHSNTTWEEKTDDGIFYMKSERLSPESSIEGHSWEMIKIAKAIKSKTNFSSTRCAVKTSKKKKVFYLWSPRNSLHRAFVTFKEGKEFANEVLNYFENYKE